MPDAPRTKVTTPSLSFAKEGGVYDFFALIENPVEGMPHQKLWSAFHFSVGIDDQRRVQSMTLVPETSHKHGKDLSAVYDKRQKRWIADNPGLSEQYNAMEGLGILADHFRDCAAAGRIGVHVISPDPVTYWRRGGLGATLQQTGLALFSTANTRIALLADPQVRTQGRCQTKLYDGFNPDRLL